MIPEICKSGYLKLYKSKNFPYEWKFVKNLYKLEAVDSLIIKEGQKTYIVTFSKGDENFLLTTDNFPEGEWKIVAQNIIPKGLRGGGSVMYLHGRIFLPI